MNHAIPSCRLCDHDHRRGSEECPARRVGKTVAGKYEITQLLGAGGMGAVYRAKHRKLGTEVALKMVHAKFGLNADVAQRFEREAQHAAALRHPGIVVVSDLGRDDDGTPFLEMELLAGKSVDEIVRSGEMKADRAVRLAIQALDALAFAHDKGVVHRDIKPENLFVTMANGIDQVKVVDFGIAKALAGQGLTTTGSVMGTPLYMSPEQLTDSKRVTTSSDVYSMGAALYEMLTGVPPIRADTLPEVMSKVMAGDINREPSKLRAELPHWVDDVVRRALARDPEHRYASAREMKEALEQRMIGGALVGAVASGSSPIGVAATLAPDAPTLPPAVGNKAAGSVGNQQGATTPPERVVGAVSVGDRTPRRNVVPLAIGGAVLAGGAIAVFAMRSSPSTTPVIDPQVARDAAIADVAPRIDAGLAPTGMVKLAGGTFEMGSTATEIEGAYKLCVSLAGNECTRALYEREQPLHKVTVAPFYLDVDEVTNEAFVAFLSTQNTIVVNDELARSDKAVYLDLKNHRGIAYDTATKTWSARVGHGRRPVVQVTAYAARSFCEHQGKRLPSEAEWEFAARGTERRRFPWGNGLLVTTADSNACDGVSYARGPAMDCAAKGAHASDVGTSRVDTTPEGVHDLGGNVAEIVSDVFVPRYPCNEAGSDCTDTATGPGKMYVVRGGYWDGLIEASRGAGRSRLEHDKMKYNVGFRCAKSIEGTP